MILSFKEVKLKKIQFSDIEKLRNWRNSPHISSKMFYQKTISVEEQQQWFKNLKDNDFYFIIEYNEIDIGLIHLTNENQLKTQAESGLYIANNLYWGGPISIYASLALLQFAFEERKLERVLAKVKKDNIIAQQYNQQLGFEYYKENYWCLPKNKYYGSVKKLINKII